MKSKETNVINLNDFKIEVGAKHKRRLRKKYECSAQAIRDALNFVTNSDKAKEIRSDAVEMLKEEIKKPERIEVTNWRKEK
jgi:hypothetical protein